MTSPPKHRPVHGFAIVSDDDCIAAADGGMPAVLRHDSDWAYFQAHLAAAALVVTGRLGHEAHANPAGRKRLVLSTRVKRFEQRDGVWWFNPAGGMQFEAAAAEIAGRGDGCIAVTGGRQVFDWFLKHQTFDAFHLTRAKGVVLSGGKRLFSDAGDAEAALARHGLSPGPARIINAAPEITVTVFARTAAFKPR